MELLRQEIRRKCTILQDMELWGLTHTEKFKKLAIEVKELQKKLDEAKAVFDSNFNKYR
tara:strand:- start:789 stop:965 length:177 start_codon:yes stop_codon:yes gene_type:complete